ncbi:MAG: hypothetical protein DRN08_05825, partial [Thermoplasmata archaeon]
SPHGEKTKLRKKQIKSINLVAEIVVYVERKIDNEVTSDNRFNRWYWKDNSIGTCGKWILCNYTW